MQAFLQTYLQIEDLAMHSQLQNDLIEHHWQLHGIVEKDERTM
jgi:hypothetical protein